MGVRRRVCACKDLHMLLHTSRLLSVMRRVLYMFVHCGYKNQASLMGNSEVLSPVAPKALPSALTVLGARKKTQPCSH
jgi:hypothetical protein